MIDVSRWKHRCMDTACPFVGQVTSRSCGCHVDERDMMAARVEALEAENATMRKLIVEADPWVQSRMQRHGRKANSEKTPYYQARHGREEQRCMDWLAGAVHFLPPESSQSKTKGEQT